MSVAELAELHQQAELLADLVDGLVRPSKRRLDDGRIAEVLPLLEAVVDARTAQVEPRIKNAVPKSVRAPVRLSAVELLAVVDRVVGGRREVSRLARMWDWSIRMRQSDSLTDVAEAVEIASWLTSAAENLLEPNRYIPLRGAICPECGFRDVTGPGDMGEDVRQPALHVEVKSGIVSCQIDGCLAMWPADSLEGLAEQLKRQTAAETLAVDPWGE